jgi:excisionase family DNA binding protein
METDDQLISLDVAATLIPGADAGTLKRKIRAGKLQAYRPGKGYLTTRADVKRMIESCRVVPKVRDSVSKRRDSTPTESSPIIPNGLSSTELSEQALELVLAQARTKKRKCSANT